MRGVWIFCLVNLGLLAQQGPSQPNPLKPEDLLGMERLSGLEFSPQERAQMMEDLFEQLQSYQALRKIPLPNGIAPAIGFQPLLPESMKHLEKGPAQWSVVKQMKRPDNLEDLAYASVGTLAYLIRTRQVSSTELTQMYLGRIKKYGPKLACVISLLEDRAMEQAARADREITAGQYRGPLHGIPYGAKDLFAVKGTRTTWGAEPYKDQIIDQTATVIERLDQAGAVLMAKLTLGALAWGDVWYGGKTLNPWNTEQGSSGSSAGSASATAAGLVAFSLGTETWGSIVSPASRCGVTGLRPSFGRVSRSGAMALSWSMDKVGPICRYVEDCAVVFDAIRGTDGKDMSLVEAPFGYRSDLDLSQLRIGYLTFPAEGKERELAQQVLADLEKIGAKPFPIKLPPISAKPLSFILSAEAAAVFDDLTRSNRDDLMTRQIKNAWPNVFRAARTIPAVEYIQANRARTLLMQAMNQIMADVDVFVAPSFGDSLLLTNLTGHPCVVVPNGFSAENQPASITFTAGLFDEARLLAVARAYQQATPHHLKRPPSFP